MTEVPSLAANLHQLNFFTQFKHVNRMKNQKSFAIFIFNSKIYKTNIKL